MAEEVIRAVGGAFVTRGKSVSQHIRGGYSIFCGKPANQLRTRHALSVRQAVGHRGDMLYTNRSGVNGFRVPCGTFIADHLVYVAILIDNVMSGYLRLAIQKPIDCPLDGRCRRRVQHNHADAGPIARGVIWAFDETFDGWFHWSCAWPENASSVEPAEDPPECRIPRFNDLHSVHRIVAANLA